MSSPLKRYKGLSRAKSLSRKSRLARAPFRCDNYGGLKRRVAKRLGTAKPREGSRRDLERRLESLLAKRVKMRDSWQLRQCSFDGVPTQGPVDAGHIYPKGKFPSGKFLVENIVAQCRTHNTRHISRPEFMFLWFEAEHGKGSLEKLHALVLSMPRKMTVEWLASEIEKSERAIADMELLAVA
jgi:hypothetical protein